MATFVYAGVSTTRQAPEGETHEVQRGQLEGYAPMDGLVLDGPVVEEGVSGSIPFAEPPAGPLLARQVEAALRLGRIAEISALEKTPRSANG
jgi:hypothetical protein